MGTPRGDACGHAILFATDMGARMVGDQPGAQRVQYVGESRRRILDFNLCCDAYVFGNWLCSIRRGTKGHPHWTLSVDQLGDEAD